MPTYLYFLLWGGLFFVMMRFGCGAHIMGHGHSHHHDRDIPDSNPANAVPIAPAATEPENEHHH